MDLNSSIIIRSEEISLRIAQLGRDISDWAAKDPKRPISILWIAEGAIFFAADLIREIRGAEIEINSVKISSYSDSLKPEHEPKITGDLKRLYGARVIIVDDIFDTGATLEALTKQLRDAGASEIKSCFLLDKITSKSTNIRPDFIGFEIEDAFVFGYGMDIAGKHRNLPDIRKLLG